MNQDSSILREFIDNSLHRLDENTNKVNKCLQDLADDELWASPNEVSNSIANLILHLCGNITQYAIASLGQSDDVRERDKEFATKSGFTKMALLQKLNETVALAMYTIKKVPLEELLRKRFVQGFNLSGIGIILHVVEHYSYHTGQIAFWVKQMKNKDLGLYEGIDLNSKNQ